MLELLDDDISVVVFAEVGGDNIYHCVGWERETHL